MNASIILPVEKLDNLFGRPTAPMYCTTAFGITNGDGDCAYCVHMTYKVERGGVTQVNRTDFPEVYAKLSDALTFVTLRIAELEAIDEQCRAIAAMSVA